ncbi:hypothetical protein [Arenibacter palladensis]|uniref:hypothetical protein n=1 Tax=Arenibacter palladensis TaxID=237373 RepID=UPI0026E2A38A|nr:hypothetical protein [Arenibacter palladensis]MDO6603728.1 hypothetical protein [Arenibacter palladensis]
MDIGRAEGVMLEKLRTLIGKSVDVDPTLKEKIERDLYALCPIGILAVLERIPTSQQTPMALNCYMFQKINGRLFNAVPSLQVDFILDILFKFKLIVGMGLEGHFGFIPDLIQKIFAARFFKLFKNKKFDLV